MDKFTTEPRPTARSTRRARGNSFYARNAAPECRSTPTPPRRCAACGADISHRRRQARTCGPTCRAHLSDARSGRTAHVSTGKRPRRRALEV